MQRFLVVAAVLAAALLPAACTGKNAGGCQLNSDCKEGETCRDGQCTAGCSTDRDCATNLRCVEGACVFPVGDAGPVPDAGHRDGGVGSSRPASSSAGGSSSGGTSSSSNGGGAEEAACSAASPCADGLLCVNLGGTLGAHCLAPCTPAADGGTIQSSCREDQRCLSTNGGGGVCARMVGRDRACADPLSGTVDPMILCEPGLTRLVDDPANPTRCACKLLCTRASCPGPLCECTSPEQCLADVLNSPTQGACGTPIQPWETCDNPFDYPFSSSDYCVVPSSVMSTNRPIPQCWYPNFDFTNFQSYCQLICDYPGVLTNAACPIGMLCLPASEDAWGPNVKTCQVPGMFADAGMVVDAGWDAGTPVDAGLDAGAGVDAGRDAGVVVDAGRDAGLDAGPADAARDAG